MVFEVVIVMFLIFFVVCLRLASFSGFVSRLISIDGFYVTFLTYIYHSCCKGMGQSVFG
jgi:hypothetical protein